MRLAFLPVFSLTALVSFAQQAPHNAVKDTALTKTDSLKTVVVTAKKSFIEQKADRTVINVDASPSSAGSSVMDILEKSPGVTVDKDGNISLKGKQGVLVMIDNKPTYMNAVQLASYLKGLPASSIDQLEIITNPSARYDAAGNSGIINIKTKKNKTKGFNGSLNLTHTQAVYAKPGGSLNMNYRQGKFNVFVNGGYTHWKGFQDMDINRNYLDVSDKKINSTFTQRTQMTFTNPEFNLKFGADYFLDKNTSIGFVVSKYNNDESDRSTSLIYLKDAQQTVDSIVHSSGTINGRWRNTSLNLNFRRQFDSSGRELTADADYVRYNNISDQYFQNLTYSPDWLLKNENILTGHLPSVISIYTFKTDYSQQLGKNLKMEAGLKTAYIATDNTADYYNMAGNNEVPDTSKTNYFVYHENINAGYISFNEKYKKWSFQAGLRIENTNYSGHQFGNKYTVVNNDSAFSKSYFNTFPTVYISYQANAKNIFTFNLGRRIDRPDYGDLNPFLFFLDQYTYQTGNPYLQPQYSTNAELSHTYNSILTTTLNYSHTHNFFSETFEQEGRATIVRNGNIGQRQNLGVAVSLNKPVTKWWMTIIYANLNYNHFKGELYGENLDLSASTLLLNMNNQFTFKKGWSAELSGYYRTSGLEGQIQVDPLGQAAAAVSKQLLKDKATLKLGIRDIFYTGQTRGTINFQQTRASFYNTRDSRQVSLSFTYRFGKRFQGQHAGHSGGADDEANRVKTNKNN